VAYGAYGHLRSEWAGRLAASQGEKVRAAAYGIRDRTSWRHNIGVTKLADLSDVNDVLAAFRTAWSNAHKDYLDHRINSEHTLQAILYFHLRRTLDDACHGSKKRYRVFTEAVVQLPGTAFPRAGAEVAELSTAKSSKSKVLIDLVVCRGSTILVAIELKYRPLYGPPGKKQAKDILSLSHVTRRLRTEDKVHIQMKRHNGEPLPPFDISPERRLILALYRKRPVGQELTSASEMSARNAELSAIWKASISDAGLDSGFWKGKLALPRKLGLAVVDCDADGDADHWVAGALASQ
jgi:hypothetical protein